MVADPRRRVGEDEGEGVVGWAVRREVIERAWWWVAEDVGLLA